VSTNRGRLAVVALLAGAVAPAAQGIDPGGWRQASPDYTLRFPEDHASHPDYRIEWWYYTGNVVAAEGRRFGYQVTFFRVGVDRTPANPSRWTVRDLFMAHLAVTDIEGGRHLVAERLNRAGVGWAGAGTETLDVWNDGWRTRLDGDAHVLSAAADDGSFGVELRLEPARGPVLHGERGYSGKGSQPGNASHYYSFTRMATSGHLIVDGARVPVEGLSWMDHEFGTSFLEPSQQGWDWFSLQLDDGTDVMVFVLRERDGQPHPQSSGTVVLPGSGTRGLVADDFTLSPGRVWVSPSSGGRYPVEWRVEIPSAGLQLDVRASLDAQELRTAESTGVTYWEGAVDVTGTREGRPVQGRGYLEMTGYGGAPISEVLR
jgi:predicted secreted hydrolase